jgi:C_GCAxxG_C_C family probable redox protein
MDKKTFGRRDMLKLTLGAGAIAAFQAPPVSLAAQPHQPMPIPNKPEYAKSRFLKSMNCSQAILESYAESMGLPIDCARKVSAAFAGGMGMGSECGAVTGAFMVIGLHYGKTADKDAAADSKTFSSVAQFVDAFKKEHGDISCSKLLGVDMGSPEGVKQAENRGLFTGACPKFVETAARILDTLLV